MPEVKESTQWRIMVKRRGNSRFSPLPGTRTSSRERLLAQLRQLREWDEARPRRRYADFKIQRRSVKTELGDWKDGIGIQ